MSDNASLILDQVELHVRELLEIDEESTLEVAALVDLRRKLESATPDEVPYLLETIEAVLVRGRLREAKRATRQKIAHAIEVARFAVGLIAAL